MSIPKPEVVAALVLALVTLASVQSKPNFAGVWVSVPDPASPAPETQLVIEHTAGELIIEHPSQAGPYKLLYKLDGSETTNTVPGRVGRGAAATTTSVAAWDGHRLVIKTNIPRGLPPQVRTIRYREVLSIDAEGRLVIEQSASLDDGAPAETRRMVYRKRKALSQVAEKASNLKFRPRFSAA